MTFLNRLAFITLSLTALSFSQSAAAVKYTLEYGKWELISLPHVLPDDMNTPDKVFGSKIRKLNPLAQYEFDWIMFSYDSVPTPTYEIAPVNEPFKKGKGYWIIQTAAPVAMTGITIVLQDSTVTLCNQYQELSDQNLLGPLTVPSYCNIL